jgi:hypothetical protein
MVEEENKEEIKKENKEEIKTEETEEEDLILKRAEEERKKAEEINNKRLELLEREERLVARQLALKQLGGGIPAGQNIKISPEEKLKQEALAFWKDTEIEKAIKKYG